MGPVLRAMACSLALFPFLLVLACGSPAGPTAIPWAAPTPAPSPKAVVISVDGLRPDTFEKLELPHMRGLLRRGAYSFRTQTAFPPVTLNAHASMLSGHDPSTHRMTWNDYMPERGYITVPTVFSIAKAAGLRTVMVAGKSKVLHLAAPGTVDAVVVTARGDRDVANEAIVQVQAGFDLMFVHFPDTDLSGHAKGWMSAAYMAQVAETDEALGRLLAVLPPETTVILTADHGGRGVAHGLNIPEDMTIPWVIAGPRVAPRGELATRVRTTDTAPTVLYLFGLKLGSGVPGTVVSEAFGAPQ